MHDLPAADAHPVFQDRRDHAKLSARGPLDVKHLHYRKVDGRNKNSLAVVVGALFDRNGNFVGGNQQDRSICIGKTKPWEASWASGVTSEMQF